MESLDITTQATFPDLSKNWSTVSGLSLSSHTDWLLMALVELEKRRDETGTHSFIFPQRHLVSQSIVSPARVLFTVYSIHTFRHSPTND